MLSRFARGLLIATALSPILGTISVLMYAKGEPWKVWTLWLIPPVILIVLCWLLLRYARQNFEEHQIEVKGCRRNDAEILVFLLTYLFPFITSDERLFGKEWPVGVYVLVLVFLSLLHAGAHHFNPVIWLVLGYQFYQIEDKDGVSSLLIWKGEFTNLTERTTVVKLTNHIYLQRSQAREGA
ncbi:hypothetical protein BH09SUM1_BH09SUM1_01150 [soil metagenome]